MILPPFAIFEQELATNLTAASPAVSLWPGKSHLPGFFINPISQDFSYYVENKHVKD